MQYELPKNLSELEHLACLSGIYHVPFLNIPLWFNCWTLKVLTYHTCCVGQHYFEIYFCIFHACFLKWQNLTTAPQYNAIRFKHHPKLHFIRDMSCNLLWQCHLTWALYIKFMAELLVSITLDFLSGHWVKHSEGLEAHYLQQRPEDDIL